MWGTVWVRGGGLYGRREGGNCLAHRQRWFAMFDPQAISCWLVGCSLVHIAPRHGQEVALHTRQTLKMNSLALLVRCVCVCVYVCASQMSEENNTQIQTVVGRCKGSDVPKDGESI